MTISTLSSREFNQDTSRAKRAAKEGPVYITDRGDPAHVLLTYEDYRRLVGGERSIIERLGLPHGVADAVLELLARPDLPRPADLG